MRNPSPAQAHLAKRTPPRANPYIAGQLLIRFDPHVATTLQATEEPPRKVRRGKGASKAVTQSALPDEVRGPLELLHGEMGLKSVQPLFTVNVDGEPEKPDAPRRGLAAASEAIRRSGRNTARETLRGFQLVETADRMTTDAQIKKLAKSKAISFVERVPRRWLCSLDPMQNRQWGLRAIRWFEAARPPATSVHVAVLDSGIDRTHPDLTGSIESYRFDDSGHRDVLGHGTHVCGIIAATTGNCVGIAGIADCRLHVRKVFDDPARPGSEAPFSFDRYSRALAEALDGPVTVINLSLGGTAQSRTEAILFEQLADAGVVTVAAMGNEFENGNPTEYPAAYDGVVAIGASDEADRRADFSCTGPHIKLLAPGVGILSTVPRSRSALSDTTDYDAWPGTSMATPHVAGAAALLYAGLGKHRDSAARVVAALTGSARKVPGMSRKAFTPQYGHGILDVKAALDAL